MTNIKKKLSELLEKCEKGYATYLSNKDYKMRNAKTEVEFQQEIDSIEKRYDFYADELLKNGVRVDSRDNVGFSRLSGDFNRGYTKAVQDIAEVFNYMNNDLKSHNMRMNYNWAEKILKCCLENREKLRDNWNGFIRTEKSESGKRDIVRWYDCRK